jgi:cell division protein FtsI/penicillin-binding protein 2
MPGITNRPIPGNPSWQEYQASLKRMDARRKLRKDLFKYSSLLTLLMLVIYGIAVSFSGTACRHTFPTPKAESNKSESLSGNGAESVYSKKDVQPILSEVDLLDLDRERFTVDAEGHTFVVETSLHIPLQQYLMKSLDRSTARDIGIVVMDPATGKIHALAGFDKTGMNGNPCFDKRFPAASIFKIVTAVAGIEKCGFRTGSSFTFNGGKYTLYKSQLKDRKNRYTTRISFQNSFAQSVNPVFGKIGANYLGKENLEEYGEGFGFNRTIDFEVPLVPSRLNVKDQAYQWAEIACGFNRDTEMSPLHGALLSAAIVNNGGLVEPTIVERITDDSGNILYRSEPKIIGYAATPGASKAVGQMMMATVRSGTSRREFRGAGRDSILSRLDIGGKTGSIGSRKIAHVRYDWFVGFAKEKKGGEKLVVSVLVAHEKYIGKRAAYYARTAIKQYFRNYFDQKKVEMHTHNQKGNRKDKTA